MRQDEHGLPIGEPLEWEPVSPPAGSVLEGRWCRLEPLDPSRHAASLHEANLVDDGSMWTYMGYGPFGDLGEYTAWCEEMAQPADPLFYATVVDGEALGVASYLRITPSVGVIEIGHISWSPALQKTTAATEAVYLMVRHAIEDLGYRRIEWKCDDLNEPSRRAAVRLGFEYEGTFRQATIYKGRNRDTAWYSIIDRDWPTLRSAYDAWLDPNNFDDEGNQRRSLRSLSKGQ